MNAPDKALEPSYLKVVNALPEPVQGFHVVLTRRSHAGEAEVAVGGRDLSNWTFDASNVLAWADDAGYSAWLQFTVLPGGPVFMGTLHPHGEEASGAGVAQIVVMQPSALFCVAACLWRYRSAIAVPPALLHVIDLAGLATLSTAFTAWHCSLGPLFPSLAQHLQRILGDASCMLAADKYRVFGELMSQPSRLAPNAAVDSTIGQLVASGLSTSATVLCTNLLRSASK